MFNGDLVRMLTKNSNPLGIVLVKVVTVQRGGSIESDALQDATIDLRNVESVTIDKRGNVVLELGD